MTRPESAEGEGEGSLVLPIGRGNIIQKAGIPLSSRAFPARRPFSTGRNFPRGATFSFV